MLGQRIACGDRHGRDRQHAGIQQLVLDIHSIAGLFLDDLVGDLHQILGEGQQHEGGADIENTVANGDTGRINGAGKEGSHRLEQHLCCQIQNQENGSADQVKADVNDTDFTGRAACADGGNHRGNTGTDVLTHDDGEGRAVSDYTGQRQSLQNTHRGRGTLDDGGEHGTHQNAQQRILELGEQFGKSRHILQGFHRIRHHIHAVHQDSKAQQDGTQILLLLCLACHDAQDTDHSQHQREVGGLEHLDQHTAAVQTDQTQQPCRNGGTDIGTHDDTHRLAQGHNTRVDQTHQHDSDSRGGLDHSRDQRTEEHTLDGAGGHGSEDALQLAAGQLFQTHRHHIHTIEEQCQAAAQRKDAKQIHTRFFLYFSIFAYFLILRYRV